MGVFTAQKQQGKYELTLKKRCSQMKVNWYFWETYRLHLQGRRISDAGSKTEDADDMFLRNIGWLSPDYIGLYPRR
jgi:hypothetical protein